MLSPDLEKPHFPAGVRSSPTSQEQGWWLQPGVSFLQEASGLALLYASSEEKQSEVYLEALRVHFAGSTPRCPSPVGRQPLRISMDTSANGAAGARPTPGWRHGVGNVTKVQILQGMLVPNSGRNDGNKALNPAPAWAASWTGAS